MSGCLLRKFSLACGITLSCILSGGMTQAQPITSDGTLPTATEVTENDNLSEITGGTARGSNLFHSFRDFSLGKGDTADFLNTDSISTIFSRVTGGNPSNIDGLIRTNNASLFFLNPAGIIFGSGARLDLGGGSFYGSTADSLLFEDGEFIATNTDNTPVLSINAPIGLGFREEPASISVTGEGTTFDALTSLEVNPGQSINLIGGNIELDAALVSAPGGRVELGGLAAAGTVDINEDGSLSFPDAVARGDVTIANYSFISVISGNGGEIRVNSQNFELTSDSSLFAGIDADFDLETARAGDIIINATEDVTIDSNGNISNSVFGGGVGNSGSIEISARNINLNNAGNIFSSTAGQGDTSNVNLNAAENISLSGNSEISSFVSGVGNGSEIDITAQNLTLTSGANINSLVSGTGDSSDISIDADTISVDEELVDESALPSSISSSVSSTGVGNSGDVDIITQDLSVTSVRQS